MERIRTSSSDDVDSSISDELTDATAIAPTKQIASSVTEGSNNDVVSFAGNDLLSGIFSPSSAHVASTSATWTPDLSIANAEPLAADASLEDIVQYACNECNCSSSSPARKPVDQRSPDDR